MNTLGKIKTALSCVYIVASIAGVYDAWWRRRREEKKDDSDKKIRDLEERIAKLEQK